MNIFSSMLGSVAGLFENAKSTIAGFFGYDEATEEIAATLTDENIDDAELDNLQETTTNFVQTIYENFDQTAIEEEILDGIEEIWKGGGELPPPPAIEVFDRAAFEHPESDLWYVEQEEAARVSPTEPLPDYQPEQLPDYENFDPDNPQEQDTAPLDLDQPPEFEEFRPINDETLNMWENPPDDDYNPDEATSDDYYMRINEARELGLPEDALLELSDSELANFLGLVNITTESSDSIEFIEDYFEAHYGDEYPKARLVDVFSSPQEALARITGYEQFYKIDVWYNWHDDNYEYALIDLGRTP